MQDILEFIQNNWAFLLVFSVIILLVWSVMKISKRNDDGKFEQDDDNDNHIKDMDIDFDCESVKHLN